jgi:hypothetical protein
LLRTQTVGTWCLFLRGTDCSQPSYDVCRFAASPEGGYCFPNPAYRSAWRSRHHAVYARVNSRRGGHHAVYARAVAPNVIAAAGRRHTMPVDLPDVLARTDPAGSAFALANTAATTATTPATTTGGAQVTVAAIPAVTNDGAQPLPPAKPTVPRTPLVLAAGMPNLNVVRSCRAANVVLGATSGVDACLDSENSARNQLVLDWSKFLAPDRTSCTQLTTMGGGGTYTELLSCLEMKDFARNLSKPERASRVAVR